MSSFMTSKLNRLKSYPFEKLNQLIGQVEPRKNLRNIDFSIGEPKHSPPSFILDQVSSAIQEMSRYPKIGGSDRLRDSIKKWLIKRYKLQIDSLDSDQNIAPVAGTREGLFSLTQAIIGDSNSKDPVVLTQNPTYQIYEGAAEMANAEVFYFSTDKQSQNLPYLKSINDEILQRTKIMYLCSPGNPSGKVIPETVIADAIKLAIDFEFLLVSDECYSEIYMDESKPPPGLLEICNKVGNENYKNCLVFHSLSKRSNLPGFRSGFAAGDAKIIQKYKRYRTYHGCSIPEPIQYASSYAWSDETHCISNRVMYRKKFEEVGKILGKYLTYPKPEASFYLWPKTPINSETFTYELFRQQNVTILPGHFMSSDKDGLISGYDRVRLALVNQYDDCVEGARRIEQFIVDNKFNSKPS